MNYAGFWIRAIAILIDSFIIGLVGGTVSFSLALLDAGLAPLLVSLAYYVLFHGGGWQATPGKRLMGIRVIRADGGRVDHGLAAGRFFAAGLSGLILFLGFIMAAFNAEKKTLHDMLCGTRVIQGKA